MTKLEASDDLITVIEKMGDGNPGGMVVCMNILQESSTIDPYSAGLQGLGYLMNLDSLGIYGSDIWGLFKDVCRENLVHTLALIRAWQLGFLDTANLKFAIDNWGQLPSGEPLDIEDYLKKVRDRLPTFGQNTPD